MKGTVKRHYGRERVEELERAVVDRKLAGSLKEYVSKKYCEKAMTLEEVRDEINKEVAPYADSGRGVDRYWVMRFCKKAGIEIRDQSEAKILQNRGPVQVSRKNRKFFNQQQSQIL
jgi:hypothetical protein